MLRNWGEQICSQGSLNCSESMGLIEITPGGGAYIREMGIENLAEPVAAIMLKERESVLDLLEARKILEVQIVKLAAQRANKSDLNQIWEAPMK